jgi:ethanolamine ammonia-lyase small subunit
VTADSRDSLVPGDWPEIVRKIRARTPARLLSGRVGAAYRTDTQLDLRHDHAAARDAVRTELNVEQQFEASFVQHWRLFEVCTQAHSKEEYLLNPNLGRVLSEASRAEIMSRCPPDGDLQIVIGDGLSVTAVSEQVPKLLVPLHDGAKACGWSFGQVFVIRHCRVGVMNEIGQLLSPKVVVLLIGERPGLATAESLSAYLAYRPDRTHTDANRNAISNIHSRGTTPVDAANRIVSLASQMMNMKSSGTLLRAEPTALDK